MCWTGDLLSSLFNQSADASPAVSSLLQLDANWAGVFTDPDSGISKYDVCVGQKAVVDNCDNLNWTSARLNTTLSRATSSRNLNSSIINGPVCVRVVAYNGGNMDSWTAEVLEHCP